MTERKKTTYIVVHCSATPPTMNIGADTIRLWHKEKGWSDIGYHLVIRRDGSIDPGRELKTIGAHVAGYNAVSVGVCLIGGVDAHNKPEDNFTPEQYKALKNVLRLLRADYPKALIVGHRDLSPDKNGDGTISPDEWLKACPSFDVTEFVARENV